MRYHLTIVILLLPLFFSGTSVPGNACYTCDAQERDTLRLKAIIERKVDSITNLHIHRLETVKQELIDSIKDMPRRRKLWMGRVDREERSDGSTYEWRWWYTIFRDDTVFYKVDIVRTK